MANVLREFQDRNEAHRFQAEQINGGVGPHPLACCTEHTERGDTTIVWDDTPTVTDLSRLSPSRFKTPE